MKIGFFDCFSGISGDMILGALLGAGLKRGELERELKKLKVGFRLKTEIVKRGVIASTHIKVMDKEEKRHRTLKGILDILEKSRLDREIKDISSRIFRRLAEAERKVHNESRIERVRLHEVGATDTIIDIVGSVIGLKKLGIERVYSSPIPVGRGFVDCAHNRLPVPAPATLELLKKIPTYGSDLPFEVTTPTGAVIVTTLSDGFGPMPMINIERIGYGAGSFKRSHPNLLRLVVGESQEGFNEKPLIMLETNVDDMPGQLFEQVMENLFRAEALDVFFTSIQMKKNRPAVKINVLIRHDQKDKILRILFEQTTTLGIRMYNILRAEIDRETRFADTPLGRVRVKLGKMDNSIVNIMPEYEDCKKIAKSRNIPLKEVYDIVRKTQK